MCAYCTKLFKVTRPSPFPADPGEQARISQLYGETPSLRPRGNLPPRVFLLRPCSSNPTGRGRRGTPRKQQHDGVAHGSRAIHRGQGVSIKPFGVTPLSLINIHHRAPEGDKREGEYIPPLPTPQGEVYIPVKTFLGGASPPQTPPDYARIAKGAIPLAEDFSS